jgi:oxalate decarboxylase
MKAAAFSVTALSLIATVIGAPHVDKRDGDGQFDEGQPISGDGKGAPILGKYRFQSQLRASMVSVGHQDTNVLVTTGGTNNQRDRENPNNLGQQSTDAGSVPSLKWAFSDSKTRIYNGGWVRQQVVSDLPSSHDIAGAQQHLKKGAIRELHWHRVVSKLFLLFRSLDHFEA